MTREQIIAVFGADTRQIDQALRAMPQKFAAFGRQSIQSLTSTLAAPLTIGGLVLAGKQVADFADNIRKTSEGLGVSTDFLQDFYATARQSGSNDTSAERGLSKLAQFIGEANEGSEEAAAKFSKFGISLTNTNGTARNTEEVMRAIADKMRDTGDGTTRAAMAMELLGKSGVDLIPTLMGGSAAIDEFGAKANKLSEMDIKAIDDAKDEFDNLGNSALIAGGKILAGVVGTIDKIRNKKITASDVAQMWMGLQGLKNPWDVLMKQGEQSVDGSPLALDTNQKDTNRDRVSRAKLLAQQFAEQKKSFEARAKAEKELNETQETNAAKVERLKKEAQQLEQDINSDKFEGTENDKKQAELAQKKLELSKAEKVLNAENLQLEKQRATEAARVAKEKSDALRGIEERRGFTIEQLADMPINRNDPYGFWKMGAQEAQNARDAAMDAFERGDINEGDRLNSYADSVVKQMGDFGGLIKPSELETVSQAMEKLNDQMDVLTGPIKSKGALPIIPHNGK